ncbi:MAG: 2Fe-2S iron-sulfur cluster-binding protein [Candidatus Acidiferrales bacterium]|jgi:xanthine dehydrogenase YagT iron-sulfur-binding subunit|nr:2Fe-2S iron-sulfur cluster-binding protein [Candidatus Acidoferrales bacterium]
MSSNGDKPRPDGAEKPDEKREKNAQETKLRDLSRRSFIKGAGIASVAASAGALLADRVLEAAPRPQSGGMAGGVVGPGEVPITLKINGQIRKLNLEPRVMLVDALRNHLDLTGAKKVCDRATCGACTVHLDGRAVYSCTTLAIDAQGRDITTIEGLEPSEGLHPMSQAFWNNDAQQCGFCTPGFVMACAAYVDHEPHPTYEGLQKSLGGNLCRCGTYMGIREAVLEAAKTMKTKGGRA